MKQKRGNMGIVEIIRDKKNILMIVASLAAALFISLLASGNTFAASKTWTNGSGDMKFSTAGNWSPSGVPTDGDSITIDASSANATINFDVTNLSLSGITVTGNNSVEFYGTGALTLTGDAQAAGGDFSLGPDTLTLGADVTLQNVAGIGGTNAGAVLDLNGHSLTLLTDSAYGVTTGSVRSKVTGSGVLTQNTPGVMFFLKNTSDYSGTTNIASGTSATTSGESNTVYGTSAINVAASAALILSTGSGSTWSFANTINFAAASTDGDGTYFNQLTVDSSSQQQVSIPNIVLNGNARFMNFGYTIGTTVDLAGIQANGHCVQYGSTSVDQSSSFLNGPSACIIGDTSIGAPNTAVKLALANPILVLAFGAVAAGLLAAVAFRIKAHNK